MCGVSEDVLIIGALMKHIAIARANPEIKIVKHEEPFTKAKTFRITNNTKFPVRSNPLSDVAPHCQIAPAT